MEPPGDRIPLPPFFPKDESMSSDVDDKEDTDEEEDGRAASNQMEYHAHDGIDNAQDESDTDNGAEATSVLAGPNTNDNEANSEQGHNTTSSSSLSLKRGLRRTAEELNAKLATKRAVTTKSEDDHVATGAFSAAGKSIISKKRRSSKKKAQLRHSASPLTTTRPLGISAPIVKGGLRRSSDRQQQRGIGQGTSLPTVEGCLRRVSDNRQEYQQQSDALPTGNNASGPRDEEIDDEQGSDSALSEPASDEEEGAFGIPSNTDSDPTATNTGSAAYQVASTDGLVEARPVTEPSMLELTRAQAVDLEAIERRKVERQKRRQRCWIAFGLAAIAVVAVAITLGVTLADRVEPKSAESIPALIPTSSPIETPTDIPSSAPTDILDSFSNTLPIYTLESLKDPSSPQSRAMLWLGKHPELLVMDDWRKNQLFALATFYYSFSGEKWPNGLDRDWLNYDVPECDWFSSDFGSFSAWQELGMLPENFLNQGLVNDNSFVQANETISPCSETGRFQKLNLANGALLMGTRSPKIPPELSLLSALQYISLSGNRINASLPDLIPEPLTRLSDLFWVDFSYNFFIHGTLPPYIHQMPNHTWLNFQVNQIKGSIPSELGLMTSLFWNAVDFNQNALTGTIPSEIGLMKIRIMSASQNRIGGSLPSELGLMSENTFWMELHENALTGTIPTELGQLTKMIWLKLQNNDFTGTLPTEIFQLTKLETLGLDSGLLATIPSELDLLTDLEDFDLLAQANSVECAFPVAIVNRSDFVTTLDLSSQGLCGSLPTEIGLLTNLEGLVLHNNSLTGPIPTEVGLITTLRTLDLSSNQLSGRIPSELGEAIIGDFEKLSLFFNNVILYDNKLTGSIPSEIAKCTDLYIFEAYGNLLSGILPSELGLLSSLALISIEDNLISGEIPSELGNIRPQAIFAGQNLLTGSIPSQMAAWGLDLSGNALAGPIPSELGSYADLAYLFLPMNQLTGTIPTELGLVDGSFDVPLARISLSNNSLVGPIPSEFEISVKQGLLVTLNVSGNALTGTVPDGLCTLQESSCSSSLNGVVGDCTFDFDCTDMLCGCNCTCSNATR